MSPKRQIRELPRPTKGYPVCRKHIEANGIVPHLLGNTSGLYWDGFTAVDKSGKFWNALSSSMQNEIINMIIAGVYGETVKDAFLDQTTYWTIRDHLIEHPNQDIINRDRLREISVGFAHAENPVPAPQ